MTKLEQVEQEIMALGPSELAALRDWFHSYLADQWDRQIEADAGKFDHLAREALAAHKVGSTKPL